MLLRLISVFILAIAFSGCASTQMKTQNEQMESRVTELEKNLQAKDAEIVDLQYQVKDLSSKVETAKPAETDQVVSDTRGDLRFQNRCDRGSLRSAALLNPVAPHHAHRSRDPRQMASPQRASSVRIA